MSVGLGRLVIVVLCSLPLSVGRAKSYSHASTRPSSCRAKDHLRDIASTNLLQLSEGSHLIYQALLHRCRWTWFQALITKRQRQMLEQGEQLNPVVRHSFDIFILSSHSPLRTVFGVGDDYAHATEVASMEAYRGSPPISVPASPSIPALPRQLHSVGNPGPETPPMVGIHVTLTTVVAKIAHLECFTEHP